MHEPRRPRSVPPGGTLGITAPAGPVDAERLEAGEAFLRDLGFDVMRSEGILEKRGYLAGDDAHRARQLTELVEDPQVDAIICARGGYGCQRILPLLVPETFRSAAKPLVGYSDVTALLLWQERCAGLLGLHGPMLERGGGPGSETQNSLREALLGADEGTRLTGVGRYPGVAEGRIRGGSLTMLASSLGTPWEIDTRGAILVFEEVNEAPYRIDRMLQQLRAAGKLEGAAVGIAVGGLVGCEDRRDSQITAEDVVLEILESTGLPVVTGLAFGHTSENRTWPQGGRARIDGEGGEVLLVDSSTQPRVENAGTTS